MIKIDDKLAEDLNTGAKRIVTKWGYLMNYWTPIIAMVGFLVAGLLWFANANGRLFTDENIKYETETNTVAARQRTFDKLDERYIKRTELDEFKKDIKELSVEIRDLRIELAKRR